MIYWLKLAKRSEIVFMTLYMQFKQNVENALSFRYNDTNNITR